MTTAGATSRTADASPRLKARIAGMFYLLTNRPSPERRIDVLQRSRREHSVETSSP